MKRARKFPVALLFAACVGLAGCDAELEDLRVLPWQPEQLAGDGDLLEDAAAITVELDVDGEPQSFSLQEGRSVTGRVAAPGGSEVRVALRTRGTSLADAFGRSGIVTLAPGAGAVDVGLVLAPPNRAQRLSVSRPDAREGAASCGAPDGRVWVAAGKRGDGLLPGSFVIDPLAREVLEGPGLRAERTRASCAWDGADGVYLLGGCALDDTPAGGLLHAPTGALGESFQELASVPEAGCDAQLLRTASGVVLAFTGEAIVRVTTASGATTSLPLATARIGARAAAAGESVLLAGGFTDATRAVPVANATLVRVGTDLLLEQTELAFEVSALGASGSGGVLAVVGDDVVVVGEDGGREVIANNVLPAGSDAAAVAWAGLRGVAVLAGAGDELLVVDSEGVEQRVVVAPARPGGALHTDAGGAVRIVGGGQEGVHVVVVE